MFSQISHSTSLTAQFSLLTGALTVFFTGLSPSVASTEDCRIRAKSEIELIEKLTAELDPCTLVTNDVEELQKQLSLQKCLRDRYLKTGHTEEHLKEFGEFQTFFTAETDPELARQAFEKAQQDAIEKIPTRIRFIESETRALQDVIFPSFWNAIQKMTVYSSDGITYTRSEFDEADSEYAGSNWRLTGINAAFARKVPELRHLLPFPDSSPESIDDDQQGLFGVLPDRPTLGFKTHESIGFLIVTQKSILGKDQYDVRWLGEGDFWYGSRLSQSPGVPVKWVRIPWGKSCKIVPKSSFGKDADWIFRPGRLVISSDSDL